MTFLQAVFLGLLQGVAEFLPISSSGHLTVVQKLFALGEVPMLFDIFLHIATLVAVVIVFYRQIADLCCVLGRFIIRKEKDGDKPKQMMILALMTATVITGVFGIVLSKIIPDLPIQAVFAGFIVTAFLLIVSSRISAKREAVRNTAGGTAGSGTAADSGGTSAEGGVSVKQGILVGFAQGIGVLPGISRSGITIASSLASGIDRKTAGEFSFLLSIPAILGAFVLEVGDIQQLSSAVSVPVLAAGCAAAFIAGLLSLKFLLTLIKKGRLEWFAAYLIPLGVLGLLFIK